MGKKDCCFICFYWRPCPGCERNNVQYGWCVRRDDFTEDDYACDEGIRKNTREFFKNL